MAELTRFLETHRDQIVDGWIKSIIERGMYAEMGPEEHRSMATAGLEVLLALQRDGDPRPMHELVRALAAGETAISEVALEDSVRALAGFRGGVVSAVLAHIPASDQLELQLRADALLDEGIAIFTGQYHARQAELIEQQTQALTELSTPVIRVWDEILVMPLVGVIDSTRGRQMMESLLEHVTRSKAAVAIVEVTGVPVIDSAVAGILLRTIDATRLLGAEVILTGMRPRIAESLVHLGVDLTSVTTCGSLQDGLQLAFTRTGREVCTTSGGQEATTEP